MIQLSRHYEIQSKVSIPFTNENMCLEDSMHGYFMLARPSQPYTSRSLIDYMNPEGKIVTTTTDINSGSSLTLVVGALLHYLCEKDLR